MMEKRITSDDIIFISLIVIIAFTAFNFGRLSMPRSISETMRFESATVGEIFNDTKIDIETDTIDIQRGEQLVTPAHIDFRVVVSKKSKSMKYHFMWCSGAKRINEENKLWFENETTAQAAGYSLAGNCTR